MEDINEFIQREIRKNGHYDKENDKDNIEMSAIPTHSSLKCFSRITVRLISGKIIPLIGC